MCVFKLKDSLQNQICTINRRGDKYATDWFIGDKASESLVAHICGDKDEGDDRQYWV